MHQKRHLVERPTMFHDGRSITNSAWQGKLREVSPSMLPRICCAYGRTRPYKAPLILQPVYRSPPCSMAMPSKWILKEPHRPWIAIPHAVVENNSGLASAMAEVQKCFNSMTEPPDDEDRMFLRTSTVQVTPSAWPGYYGYIGILRITYNASEYAKRQSKGWKM